MQHKDGISVKYIGNQLNLTDMPSLLQTLREPGVSMAHFAVALVTVARALWPRKLDIRHCLKSGDLDLECQTWPPAISVHSNLCFTEALREPEVSMAHFAGALVTVARPRALWPESWTLDIA